MIDDESLKAYLAPTGLVSEPRGDLTFRGDRGLVSEPRGKQAAGRRHGGATPPR